MGKFVQPKTPRWTWLRTALLHVAGIFSLSTLLGLSFNASNPIGIRWSPEMKPAKMSLPTIAESTGTRVAAVNAVASSTSHSVSSVHPPLVAPIPSPDRQSEVAHGFVVDDGAGSIPGIAEVRTDLRPTIGPVAPDLESNPPPAARSPTPTLFATPTSRAEAKPLVAATPVSWGEAKPLVAAGKVVLIDARPRALYEAGHIPGAVSLPESSTTSEINEFQKQHGPNSLVIVYCGSQSCSLSKRLADRLVQQHGYVSVRFMTGGYQEWLRAEQSADNTTNR